MALFITNKINTFIKYIKTNTLFHSGISAFQLCQDAEYGDYCILLLLLLLSSNALIMSSFSCNMSKLDAVLA